MNDLDYIMGGFNAEMSKEAFLGRAVNLGRRVIQSPALQRGLGGIGAGAGAGGALGAVGGATYGGIRGLQEARERGDSGIGAALVGAGEGAIRGGLWGAGLGAAGLGGAAALSKGVGERFIPALAARSSAARFGQRQIHGMTGWTPQGMSPIEGVKSIRGGSWSAAKNVEEAGEALRAAQEAPAKAGIMGTILGRAPEAVKAKQIKALDEKLQSAKKGLQYAEEAERMGLTSLPGYLRSLATPGQAGKTITTGLKEQWHGSGPVGRALTFGFPAATIGYGALATPDPGSSRAEAAMGALGDVAYSLGPLPIAPQLALGSALSMSGARLGRLLSGKKKKPQLQEPSPNTGPGDEPSQDIERYYSDRALGYPGGFE